MSETAMLILEIYRRHMRAAQAGDEALRARLFALVEELEWAFPEAAKEVDERYPVNK